MKITGNNHQPFAKDSASDKIVTENKEGASGSKSTARMTEASARIASGSVSSKIKEHLDKTPDANAEKVAELKKKIQSGAFTVDPGKIADGLIREAAQSIVAEQRLL